MALTEAGTAGYVLDLAQVTDPAPKATHGNFETKANLTDITNPLAPKQVGSGNLTLKISVQDNSEPGNTDKIGIALFNGSTLVFSTNLNAPTVLQLLGGGGICRCGRNPRK